MLPNKKERAPGKSSCLGFTQLKWDTKRVSRLAAIVPNEATPWPAAHVKFAVSMWISLPLHQSISLGSLAI